MTVHSNPARQRRPYEPRGEGQQTHDREREDRLVRARDAPLGLPKGEREDRDPQEETRTESHQDGGAKRVDQDEPRREPPEDRVGARDVGGPSGHVRRRELVWLWPNDILTLPLGT